jgi:hypothetical protein
MAQTTQSPLDYKSVLEKVRANPNVLTKDWASCPRATTELVELFGSDKAMKVVGFVLRTSSLDASFRDHALKTRIAAVATSPQPQTFSNGGSLYMIDKSEFFDKGTQLGVWKKIGSIDAGVVIHGYRHEVMKVHNTNDLYDGSFAQFMWTVPDPALVFAVENKP